MKTPEQIAAEVFPFDGSDPDTIIEARARTASAIRADRYQREPYVGTEFKVGDVVRLTGPAWDRPGIHNELATVIPRSDRWPEHTHVQLEDGTDWYVFRSRTFGSDDYSATLVSRKEG